MRSAILKRRIFQAAITSVFITLFFVAFLLTSPVFAAETDPLPSPAIISPIEGEKISSDKPIITGNTLNGAQVHIFVDDELSGSATVSDNESGTANFSYSVPSVLKPGRHTISAIAAVDANTSEKTEIKFEVIGFVPPTLLKPIVNSKTTPARPFIVGVAKNDSLVKIFIDGEYDGELFAQNNPSGTATFSYLPKNDLTLGLHQLKAIAVDRISGRESLESKLMTFLIKESPPSEIQPPPAPTELLPAPVLGTGPAPALLWPYHKGASWQRPYIHGTAPKGSRIEVYVNGVMHPIDFTDDSSDATRFYFRPKQDLPYGLNHFYAIAYSPDGQKSPNSNTINWRLLTPEQLQIVLAGAQTAEPDVEISVDGTADSEGTEPDIEIDIEDRSDDADVVIEDQGGTDEPPITGTVDDGVSDADVISDDTEGEGEEGEEGGTNWSKIIGLVILAILIIALIIQLLKKEEPDEEKKGETLDLFDSSKPEEKKDLSAEASHGGAKAGEPKADKKDDIPPPPPPSSNLPF